MKLEYAVINAKATCGDEYLLTEIKPVYEYVINNRIGDPVAYNYMVVLPKRKYDQLRVRIDGACQINDALSNPVPVKIDGLALEIRWSRSDGNYIAGTASGIAVAAGRCLSPRPGYEAAYRFGSRSWVNH